MKKKTIIIVIVLVACALLIAGYLLYLKFKPGSGKQDADTSILELPGDFVWEGEYIDDIEGYAVLTIEKSGNEYACSIAIPSADVSYINSYTFGARLSTDKNYLEYSGCVHSDYLIPPAESDEPVTATEISTDGSGQIYYLDGYLIWIDEKEDAGQSFLFRKLVDEPAETGEDIGGGQ